MSSLRASRSWINFGTVAMLLVLSALILGGASRPEVLSTLIVRLIAIGVLGTLIATQSPRLLLEHWLALTGVLVVAAQLIPLPYGMWSNLPGRGLEIEIVNHLPNPHPWMPWSMHPPGTYNSLLSLLPPLALFLVMPLVSDSWRRRLAVILVAIAVINGLLGLFQLAGGVDTPLRFYAITNRDSAVGLFANRNHSANLMACAIPFAFWWSAYPSRKTPRNTKTLLAAGIAALLLICVAATQSRTGLVLASAATIGSAAIFHFGTFRKLSFRGRLIGALFGAAILASGIALFPAVLSRVTDTSVAEDLRFVVFNDLVALARAMWPAGSGFGSFDAVYRSRESVDILRSTYLNHAHNDLLELVIEGGLTGLLLLAAVAVWLVRRTVAVVRAALNGDAFGKLAICGLFVITTLLAHSLFDYPLRTPALACVMAFAAGLLVAPRSQALPKQPNKLRAVD